MSNKSFEVIPSDPPPGWECETPKYRATRDIQPAEKARFRFETPFAHSFDSNTWQYGSRSIQTGEIVETREWPHASFRPLNYSAAKVLDFFNTRMKSRLPRSPWEGNRLRLDDGLTGAGIMSAVLPQLRKVDLRPNRLSS
jgi:hypothetical protein